MEMFVVGEIGYDLGRPRTRREGGASLVGRNLGMSPGCCYGGIARARDRADDETATRPLSLLSANRAFTRHRNTLRE